MPRRGLHSHRLWRNCDCETLSGFEPFQPSFPTVTSER
jgi:hypothetical protein